MLHLIVNGTPKQRSLSVPSNGAGAGLKVAPPREFLAASESENCDRFCWEREDGFRSCTPGEEGGGGSGGRGNSRITC